MAATDPVDQIQVHAIASEIAGGNELTEQIADLAALPPADEALYLTVYLDWRPDGAGPGRRPARRLFEDEAERLLARHAAHEPARESLSADVERIRAYLDGDAPNSAQGLAFFACDAQGVFTSVPLGKPTPTRIADWPTPALSDLARLIDDFPRFLIVQIEQRDALVSIVDQTRAAARIEVSGDDYPRHQAQGGWSQRRFQARAEERIEAFARAVAALTRTVVETGAIDHIILMGDDVNIPPLRAAMHQTITEKVVGMLPSAMNATEQEVLDLTLPLIDAAERERELHAVRALRDAIGANGPGAAGAATVLTALQAGQVQTLVMNDDFTGPGWADYSLPLYGAGGPPGAHPAGGNAANLVSISLPEETIRLAIITRAEIEIVRSTVPISEADLVDVPEARGEDGQPRSEAARLLDEMGGIGALLRFTSPDDQPVARRE